MSSSIRPAPQSGAAPVPASESRARVTAPRAGATPVPYDAGRKHVADMGDYITLGIGLAGVGALGIAAAGGIEAASLGGAVLATNAGTAAREFGPTLAKDWQAGVERLKDPAEVGKFAAEQTTAGLSDYARGGVVGAGISAGVSLAQHVVRALSQPAYSSQPAGDCRP